jgi:hypothetical protein
MELTEAEDVALTEWWVSEGGDAEDLAIERLTDVVERIFADRLAAVQAEVDAMEVGYNAQVSHARTHWLRAESAEAERDNLRALLAERDQQLVDTARDLGTTRARLLAVETLFAGGPDTPCRTTWRNEFALAGPTECVEVPMDDLRAVLASPSTHEPRCNTYCRPGSHYLTDGIGYPHIHRTDIGAECGECHPPTEEGS